MRVLVRWMFLQELSEFLEHEEELDAEKVLAFFERRGYIPGE